MEKCMMKYSNNPWRNPCGMFFLPFFDCGVGDGAIGDDGKVADKTVTADDLRRNVQHYVNNIEIPLHLHTVDFEIEEKAPK